MVNVQVELLGNLFRRSSGGKLLPLSEIGLVEFEDAETTVLVFAIFKVELAFFGFVQLFYDPPDAFFANIRYRLIARLEGFAVLCAGLWELNADKLAVAVVLFVEVEHGVGGSGGAGEEVEDDRISFDFTINYK